MKNNYCRKICRFCLQTSDSNFETIEEVTFAHLDFLWLKLNLSISEDPVMCGDCGNTIRTCLDFKTRCLEIENYIVSPIKEKDSIKIDVREVYVCKMSIENKGNVPDCTVCCLCLELIKNGSSIFLRDRTDITQNLEQYFPELDLICLENAVACVSCLDSLEHYFNFMKNCIATEEKIMEYCKVEGTNSKGQIDLNSILHFISKDVLKYKFEVDTLKIEGTCSEDSENASNSVEMKEETLHMELDIKEDSSMQESELTDDENSFRHHPSPSQSDCLPELTGAKPTKYLSETCGYQNDRGPLQAQILSRNGIVQEYSCEICTFKTKTKGYLKRHMLKHKDVSEVAMYKCTMCPYQGKRKQLLQVHMITHKDYTDVIMFKCDLCDYQTRHKRNLPHHKLIHMDKSEVKMYKCDVCPYKTKFKRYLPLHQLSHRDTEDLETQGTVYKCDLCDYKAKRKYYLSRHMLTHKTQLEVTMYKCELCDYKTKRKGDVKNHLATHKTHSGYKCDLCDHKAKRKGYLKRHMLTHKTHLEVTMYKCEQCDHKTKRKSDLKGHLLTHKTYSDVTVYKCDLCDFKAKRKNQVKMHVLIHKAKSDVTMYKCYLCTYETKWKSTLSRHMLTHKPHSEIIMYKCETCAFETKYKDNLQKHKCKLQV